MIEKHPCFVRISKPVRNRLRTYARRAGQSMSQAATQILEKHLTVADRLARKTAAAKARPDLEKNK